MSFMGVKHNHLLLLLVA